MHTWRSRKTVQAGCLFLLAVRGGGRHGFRCADEIVARLEVEEVQILQVVILWTLENVEWNTQRDTILVYCVEELEEDLRKLVSTSLSSLYKGELT